MSASPAINWKKIIQSKCLEFLERRNEHLQVYWIKIIRFIITLWRVSFPQLILGFSQSSMTLFSAILRRRNLLEFLPKKPLSKLFFREVYFSWNASYLELFYKFLWYLLPRIPFKKALFRDHCENYFHV